MAFVYSPKIVTNGLVLALDAADRNSYPGTGTAWSDLSGNGNNGTLTNGPTFNSANGGSIVFDGTNDYVLLSRMISDDFTLSCWVKTSQAATGTNLWWQGYGLIDGEVAGTFNDFGLAITAGKAAFGTGNPDVSVLSLNDVNDNIWYNIVGTRIRSSGALVLYVNGTQVGTGTGNTSSLTAPPNIRIGSIRTGFGYLNGNIAQASIYNRALSATEIQQNYNATKSRFGL